ncbi:MAG: 5'-3' exonuclease [Mycoplasmoidaceae bacterium]
MNKKAIVIDGNSLLYRAYYATYKQLEFYKAHNLKPLNALKLMLQIFFKLLYLDKYDYAVIAYDHKDKTFRDDMFDDYKKNRKRTPQELIDQIPLIHEISKLFGFQFECISGIEADDVVGSAAKLLSKNNVKVDVYTSDKDILQLVDENINVILFKKGISDTLINTLDNFKNLNEGLMPNQIPDFKGIAGDASDNFIGVKGIGKKTAVNLLLEFENIDGIYNNLDKIKSKATQEKLTQNKENAFMFRDLATIETNYFNDKSIEYFKIKNINYDELKKIIKKYNLNGFDRYLGE